MTRDDVIRMARDAGFQEGWTNLWAENFERFAALVAAAEREACAKACEDSVSGFSLLVELAQNIADEMNKKEGTE